MACRRGARAALTDSALSLRSRVQDERGDPGVCLQRSGHSCGGDAVGKSADLNAAAHPLLAGRAPGTVNHVESSARRESPGCARRSRAPGRRRSAGCRRQRGGSPWQRRTSVAWLRVAAPRLATRPSHWAKPMGAQTARQMGGQPQASPSPRGQAGQRPAARPPAATRLRRRLRCGSRVGRRG